jgi:hypothetical protein
MKEVYLNDVQSIFQKLIIWTKKSSKGRQEWEVPCVEINLPPWKLKTFVKTWFDSKIVFFQKALEYICTITCYSC